MVETETRKDVISKIRDRWDSLVKPPGSLGDLEEVVVRLGDIQGTTDPRVEPGRLFLFAGDHGVTEENVSAFPSSVTEQMLRVIDEGGAAINSLCDSAGLELEWYNVGVDSDRQRNGERIGRGTDNMTADRALSEGDLRKALDTGREALRSAVDDGVFLVALGEIGIGNTTASSAVIAAILECPARNAVGPGTGVQGEQLQRKINVVKEAVERHQPDPSEGHDVLEAVGGYELAAQAGAILEAHERDVPVLLDGFITGAAALAASRIEPESSRVLLASHVSDEPAHKQVLDAMDLDPLTDLNLRLGEGSGAAVAYPILKSALACYRGMDTFEEAGIVGDES